MPQTNLADGSPTMPVSLSDRLDQLEAIVRGPAPEVNGSTANTLAQWLDRLVAGEPWPQNALPGSTGRYDWEASKNALRDLVRAARDRKSAAAPSDLERERIRPLVRAFGGLGAIAALNGNNDDGTPSWPIEPSRKSAAFKKVLEGWHPSGPKWAIPGIDALVLESDHCPISRIASREFYTGLFDAALNGLNEQSRVADVLRPYLADPVIVARDAWIRFLLRFHRSQATMKDAITSLLPGRRKGGTASGVKEFWALRGIDFVAYPGDTIGVVGRNGSGKTTLLKALAGILVPDRGQIQLRGKIGCLLSFGVGFNSNLSGRENIFLNGSILGLSEREIRERVDRIIDFSELGEFIDAPVRTYSSGMRGRLGFSIAVNIDPDILILDEVLTVGDDYFQKKAGSILDRFHQARKTIVIASHSMDLIRQVATYAIWIDKGKIRMGGDPSDVTRAYVAESRDRRAANAGAEAAAHEYEHDRVLNTPPPEDGIR